MAKKKYLTNRNWIRLPNGGSIEGKYVQTIEKNANTYTATIINGTTTETVSWTVTPSGSDQIYLYEMSVNQQGEIEIDVGEHYEDIIEFFNENGYFPRIAGILSIPTVTDRYYVELKQVLLSSNKLEMTGNFERVFNGYVEYNAITVTATPTSEYANMLIPTLFEYHGSEYISIDWNEDQTAKIISFDFTNLNTFIEFPQQQNEVVLSWVEQVTGKPLLQAELNQELKNKINNSLQKPQSTPTFPELVGFGSDGNQKRVRIGSGLTYANDTLSSTGGEGGTPLYLHCVEFIYDNQWKFWVRTIDDNPNTLTLAQFFSNTRRIVSLFGTRTGGSDPTSFQFMGSMGSSGIIFTIGYDNGIISDLEIISNDCTNFVDWGVEPLNTVAQLQLKKLKSKKSKHKIGWKLKR